MKFMYRVLMVIRSARHHHGDQINSPPLSPLSKPLTPSHLRYRPVNHAPFHKLLPIMSVNWSLEYLRFATSCHIEELELTVSQISLLYYSLHTQLGTRYDIMGNEESTLAGDDTIDEYDEDNVVLKLETIQSEWGAAREEQGRFGFSSSEQPAAFEFGAGQKVNKVPSYDVSKLTLPPRYHHVKVESVKSRGCAASASISARLGNGVPAKTPRHYQNNATTNDAQRVGHKTSSFGQDVSMSTYHAGGRQIG